jgi:peptide/nickel transport system permease protein
MALVSLLVFVLLALSPGDPAREVAGEFATPEAVEKARHELGLDKPLVVQYVDWIGGAIHGDLGRSWRTDEEVSTVLSRAIGTSLSLVAISMAISIVFALAGGIISALKPRGLVDRSITLLSSIGVALPSFWVALLLVSWFAVRLGWFPAVGYVPITESPYEWAKHLVLPAISLAGVTTAELARQLRGSLQDVLASDYVLAAHAKGIKSSTVVVKHGLKNALSPALAVLSVRVSQLIGGSVIIETIFNIRGLGLTVVRAALTRDVPIVLGVTVVTSVVVLVCSLAIEIIHPFLNPKLRTA